MKLCDLNKYIEIDIAEALEERFMESEELYVRFLKKLEAANDLAVVEGFVAEENWPEAMRKAHNLKGVCASLGLTRLTAQLAELVKLLRSDGFTKEQVYTTLELRMKCGVGKCGRCNIGKKYVCKDGPVFTCDQLDEMPDEY